MLSWSPGCAPTGSPPSMKIDTAAAGVTLKMSLPALPFTVSASALL
jgi:hypothetical protein